MKEDKERKKIYKLDFENKLLIEINSIDLRVYIYLFIYSINKISNLASRRILNVLSYNYRVDTISLILELL